MAESGTDQHQSRIAIREAAHYSGAAANLPVEPFHDIVGADTSPVLAGKVAVSKRLFNAVFYLLGSLAQLHGTKLLHHRFSLLPSSLLLSWAWIALSILATNFTLERGVTEKTLR